METEAEGGIEPFNVSRVNATMSLTAQDELLYLLSRSARNLALDFAPLASPLLHRLDNRHFRPALPAGAQPIPTALKHAGDDFQIDVEAVHCQQHFSRPPAPLRIHQNALEQALPALDIPPLRLTTGAF